MTKAQLTSESNDGFDSILEAKEAKKLLIDNIMKDFDFTAVNNLIVQACANFKDRVEISLSNKFDNGVVKEYLDKMFEKKGYKTAYDFNRQGITLVLYWQWLCG